jgi:hypothetical protein
MASPPAATALCLGTRFIHNKVPPTEILTVEGIYGTFRVFVGVHFDEGETARLPRETVANKIYRRGSYADLREPFVELVFRRGKGKIPDIKLLHQPTPSARNPRASRGARWRDSYSNRGTGKPSHLARGRCFSGQVHGLEKEPYLQPEIV